MNNENENENCYAFKVFIRIRPYNEKERLSIANSQKKQKNMLQVEDNLLFVLDPESQELYGKKEKNFAFDGIYTEADSNYIVFEKVIKNMVGNILQGYNSTALAYGVTGTGKTHTMFGDIYNVNTKEKGICIYAIDHLFDMINSETNKNFQVKLSYLEIYNEQVRDLLKQDSNTLMIVEDQIKGVVVPDLMEFIVSDSFEVIKLIIEGNERRIMAPTGQNQFSSRSHAIIQILVEQRNKVRDTKEEVMNSKFLLVDLAGCERGGLEKGIRSQEGANINKSLLALGTCINILSDKTKKGCFVPYRDSKLTRLLKDSLGGNIMTGMISCVSPSYLTYDETLNTLKYASRARTIQKKISKNVNQVDAHISQYKEIIDSLKNEIGQLKDIINTQNIIISTKDTEKVLENEIMKNEKEMSLNPKDFEGENMENKEKSIKSSISKNIVAATSIEDIEKYKNFLTKEFMINHETNYEDLEKQVENLQINKMDLEEQIEKGNEDKIVAEKYKLIKSCYEKYLEIINDKLVENIEQNMILKFNMKEIMELNETNITHVDLIQKQIENYEKIKTENPEDSNETENEIKKLTEEINNIHLTIQENETIKERIATSLEKNTKFKKILKKILIRLISNSQKEITDLHQAYKIMEKEKHDLLDKNKKFQEYLKMLSKEKEKKDQKFSEVQKELQVMKKLLYEKEKKLVQYESQKINEKSVSLRNIQSKSLTKIKIRKDDESVQSISTFKDNMVKEKPKNKNILNTDEQHQRINTNIYINNNINTINNIHKAADSEKSMKSNKTHKILPKNISAKSKKITNKLSHKSEKSKSPRQNKFKDFDKIIETQLNEVYSKKAKEIGDKMRKNIFNKPTKGYNFSTNLMTNQTNIPKLGKERDPAYKIFSNIQNYDNNQGTKVIKQGLTSNSEIGQNPNHSLSISNVNFQNEVCYNSEIDVYDNANPHEITDNKKPLGKSLPLGLKNNYHAQSTINQKKLHLQDLASESGMSKYGSPGKIQDQVYHSKDYDTLTNIDNNQKYCYLQKKYESNSCLNLLTDGNTNTINDENKRNTPNVLNRNIDKFLNKHDSNTQSRKYLTENSSLSHNYNSTNNNLIKTDNSAAANQKILHQARVERQLKNKENRNQIANISKNSELFLNEYLNAKKVKSEISECDKITQGPMEKVESNMIINNIDGGNEKLKESECQSIILVNFCEKELNFPQKNQEYTVNEKEITTDIIEINPIPNIETNNGITFQNKFENDVKHDDNPEKDLNKIVLLPEDLLKNMKNQRAAKYLN